MRFPIFPGMNPVHLPPESLKTFHDGVLDIDVLVFEDEASGN